MRVNVDFFEFDDVAVVVGSFRGKFCQRSHWCPQVSLEHINTVTKGPVRVDGNGVPVPKPRCELAREH